MIWGQNRISVWYDHRYGIIWNRCFCSKVDHCKEKHIHGYIQSDNQLPQKFLGFYVKFTGYTAGAHSRLTKQHRIKTGRRMERWESVYEPPKANMIGDINPKRTVLPSRIKNLSFGHQTMMTLPPHMEMSIHQPTFRNYVTLWQWSPLKLVDSNLGGLGLVQE